MVILSSSSSGHRYYLFGPEQFFSHFSQIAKLLVDLSKSQDNEIGDGTTGVVIMAGALLEQALKLLEKGMHPLRIATGYEKSCEIACDRVKAISREVDVLKDDCAALKKAAATALGSKIVSSQQHKLAGICVEAVLICGPDKHVMYRSGTRGQGVWGGGICQRVGGDVNELGGDCNELGGMWSTSWRGDGMGMSTIELLIQTGGRVVPSNSCSCSLCWLSAAVI